MNDLLGCLSSVSATGGPRALDLILKSLVGKLPPYIKNISRCNEYGLPGNLNFKYG